MKQSLHRFKNSVPKQTGYVTIVSRATGSTIRSVRLTLPMTRARRGEMEQTHLEDVGVVSPVADLSLLEPGRWWFVSPSLVLRRGLADVHR
ncbi:uncharacterized protein LOC135434364 isoform X2 [Drosophila montana]